MDSLASPVQDTLSVFDIQNDINLIDTIHSKIQQMDSLKDQNLASYSARIEGMHAASYKKVPTLLQSH